MYKEKWFIPASYLQHRAFDFLWEAILHSNGFVIASQ